MFHEEKDEMVLEVGDGRCQFSEKMPAGSSAIPLSSHPRFLFQRPCRVKTRMPH